MAKANLTETIIKKIKHKPKQFKISDGEGLYLLVHPNGSKYWRFDFRFAGKQKSSSLGVWPELYITQATTKRNSAKKKIREGINPIEEKRKKRTVQIINNDTEEKIEKFEVNKSFKPLKKPSIINPFLSSREYDNQVDFNEFILDVFPDFGEKGFSELAKEDVIKIIKNIFENRKKLFRIFWEVYPSNPLLQISVLFMLLFITTDIVSAFFITIFYFLFSVIFSIGFDYWINK